MIEVPKLVVVVLLGFVVWYAMRWWNRPPASRPRAPGAGTAAGQRQRRASAPPKAVEDLVACRQCGTYITAGAAGCGKPDCPRAR
ncbi:MAG TPA: hypothetical protein VND95_06760 [Stellaceae bacterium]|nr:hypothetical protein [Stellaceae bacterium]